MGDVAEADDGVVRRVSGRPFPDLRAMAARGLGPGALAPLHVASYVGTHVGVWTVKQHLPATRALRDCLVIQQVLATDPAASVRSSRHVVTKGATPVPTPAETRALLGPIDVGTLVGLQHRALVSVIVYSDS